MFSTQNTFHGTLKMQYLEVAVVNAGNGQWPKVSRRTEVQKALASFYLREILSDFFALKIWDSANVQFMRSSHLYKIIVKSLCFFISIYGWGILSFLKSSVPSQNRHDEESLTLMTTLSTQKACSGGQLKVEKHFFSSSFSLKGNKR